MNEGAATKSDMVDRVAKALFDQEWGGHSTWEGTDEPDREYWRRSARLALETMREPTPEMLGGIVRAIDGHFSGPGTDFEVAYRNMIDAALGKNPT